MKKLVSIVLVLALCLSLCCFAFACNKDIDVPDPEPAPTPDPTPDPDPEPTPPPAEPEYTQITAENLEEMIDFILANLDAEAFMETVLPESKVVYGEGEDAQEYTRIDRTTNFVLGFTFDGDLKATVVTYKVDAKTGEYIIEGEGEDAHKVIDATNDVFLKGYSYDTVTLDSNYVEEIPTQSGYSKYDGETDFAFSSSTNLNADAEKVVREKLYDYFAETVGGFESVADLLLDYDILPNGSLTLDNNLVYLNGDLFKFGNLSLISGKTMIDAATLQGTYLKSEIEAAEAAVEANKENPEYDVVEEFGFDPAEVMCYEELMARSYFGQIFYNLEEAEAGLTKENLTNAYTDATDEGDAEFYIDKDFDGKIAIKITKGKTSVDILREEFDISEEDDTTFNVSDMVIIIDKTTKKLESVNATLDFTTTGCAIDEDTSIVGNAKITMSLNVGAANITAPEDVADYVNLAEVAPLAMMFLGFGM